MHSVRLAARLPLPSGIAALGRTWTPVQGDGRFSAATLRESLADARAAVAPYYKDGATVGVAPASPVRAVFFDMDATVVAEESIVELAARAGRGAEVQAITERAMRGELDFEAALRQRVGMLKGAPASVIQEVRESLTLNPGIVRFVSVLKTLGVPAFLVSGGFVELAESVAKVVGFAAFDANRLEVAGGRLTGALLGGIVDGAAKRRFLLSTCERLKISPLEVAAVGDGANDLLMMGAAGVAVGFRPKPVLWPHIHAQDAVGDFGFLGPLLLGRAGL